MCDPRFYTIEYVPESHRSDLLASIERGDIIPVCDEDAGIIGYALGDEHADTIVAALNREDK